MEFCTYCTSSNKKYPLFFLVDPFELQCDYAAVHTAKCELITIPHEMHSESVFNIDTVSNMFPYFPI
jgi:flagellar assembly factor FliW